MKRKQTNRPLNVYVVDGEGDNAYWTKLGAAFAHEDGKGFSVTLNAMPLTGRLIIREPKAQEAR